MRSFIFGTVAGILLCCKVAAQQTPIFDPDDSLDPRQFPGQLVFSARVVAGSAWNFIDDYRPVDDTAQFIQLGGGVYWERYELDYKRSIRNSEDPAFQICACDPEQFFPTPPLPDATPAAPPSGTRDSLQFAWYYSVPNRVAVAPRIMMRLRGTWARQSFQQDVISPVDGRTLARRSGRDQSFGLEGDTRLPIPGRDLFGTIRVARTIHEGVATHRTQTEFTYSHRFPGTAYKRILLRAILTTGAVTNRGGTAINLVNPYFEAFFHESTSRVNFHLVYSPQLMNSGAEGWRAHHQVALFADWGVVRLFGKP